MAYVKKKPIRTPESLAELLSIIPDVEVPRARAAELQMYQDFFEGNKAATGWKYFSPPGGTKDVQCAYDENRDNLLLINRTRTLCRVWSALLNGNVSRAVHDCPNREIIEDYVTGHEFAEAVGTWKRNSILYGCLVIVPVFDPEEQILDLWMPFPVRTVILTEKTNVKKVVAVIEINDGFTQFVSKFGEGIVYDDGTANVSPREYDRCPCVIGYGYSRLHERQVYGQSMCKEAVEFSIAESKAAFNIALLARQQTRDILSIVGDLSKISQHVNDPDVDVGMSSDGTLVLPENFQAQFLRPDPKIAASLSVGKYFQALFSSVSGLPVDIIAPDQVTNPSNESARIRSTALIAEAKEIVPRWIAAETNLIHSIIYLVDFFLSEESPETSFVDIKRRSNVEVKNNYSILPVSSNEISQDNISLVAAGLRRRADAIKELNPTLTAEEIDEMIEDYMEKLTEGNRPHVIEQFSLKTGKQALTPEQKAELENEE